MPPSFLRPLISLLLAFAAAAAAALSIRPVNAFPIPKLCCALSSSESLQNTNTTNQNPLNPKALTPRRSRTPDAGCSRNRQACEAEYGSNLGLSGITRVSGDSYLAVDDSGGLLYPLSIQINPSSGAITNASLLPPLRLPGRSDLEGVAWDPALNLVWVADETDASITAFNPSTAAPAGSAPVPKIFKSFRPNRSLESLSISPNALEMWTASEEALAPDGPLSSPSRGSLPRFQQFTRPSPSAPWRPAAQFSYPSDPFDGRDFAGKARCGVADLCALPNGSLLVLERAMRIPRNSILPSFRCRIYSADFSSASPTAAIPSLAAANPPPTPARKSLLFSANTALANYEGICLGPALPDGSQSLILISDGDAGGPSLLFALTLKY